MISSKRIIWDKKWSRNSWKKTFCQLIIRDRRKTVKERGRNTSRSCRKNTNISLTKALTRLKTIENSSKKCKRRSFCSIWVIGRDRQLIISAILKPPQHLVPSRIIWVGLSLREYLLKLLNLLTLARLRCWTACRRILMQLIQIKSLWRLYLIMEAMTAINF